MIELNRSSFWAKYRKVLPALVLFSLLALLIGCGGGGGGGGGNGGPGGGTGTIPNAPTGLVATPGNGQISLQWNASTGATSYNVLRALAPGGPYAAVVNGHPLTSFTNAGLTNGTTYFYKVTATNVNGTSGDSNVASATPTAGGGGGASWLPANTIFYRAADDTDPTASEVRRIESDGSDDALFLAVPNQFIAAMPNPNVTNQIVFAHTNDAVVTASSVYALYRNTSVSLAGAVKLTDHLFHTVGSIGFTLDGQKVFFTAAIGADHGLYFMNPNGTSLERETSADDANMSQDGTKILISQLQGSQNDIFYLLTSEAAQTGPATATVHPLISTTSVDEIMPQWSKDGTKFVFTAQNPSDPSPNFEVFIRGFSGGATTQLTANGDDNLSPSLSPDGGTVAFARLSSNVANSGLYRVAAAGGSQANIILNSSIDAGVYWTSNTGRAVGGGFTMTIGRTLKDIRRR